MPGGYLMHISNCQVSSHLQLDDLVHGGIYGLWSLKADPSMRSIYIHSQQCVRLRIGH